MARKTTKVASKAPPSLTLLWLEIENFKSVKKLHLELRPFMVFVGPNGAGKTNLLQALALLLDLIGSFDGSVIERYGGYDQLARRGARRAAYIRLAIGIELRDKERPRRITFDVRLTAGTRGAPVHTECTFTFGPRGTVVRIIDGEVQSGSLVQMLNWKPPSTAVRLRLDASALRRDAASADVQGGLLGLSGDGLPRAVERVRGTPAFRRVLTGLQAVYPRIEDVDTVQLLPGEVALRFKERAINQGLGQANVSDGVMHAVALLLVLEGSPPDSTLLIEEPENALHPWALRTIIQRVQETPRPGPLLLATHSPTLIDAVEDPASLYIVENDEKKGTVVTSALTREKALRVILAESGQKLGEVWLGGLLGGVPDGGV